MNCIVIDDEPLAREGMQLLIAEIPWLTLKGYFPNVMQADLLLRQEPVDLLFLDIHMPKMTGIEYLRRQKNPPKVIITTAHPEYALEGFELDVVDYLVKPIRFERFYKAVSKALADHPEKNVQQEISRNVEEDFFFIRADKKFVRLNTRDILYIEGLKDYVRVHCEGELLTVAMNLKTIQAQLPPELFVRVNKSWIVNLSRVKSVEQDFITVGKEQIPIGDAYREALLHFIRKKGIVRR